METNKGKGGRPRDTFADPYIEEGKNKDGEPIKICKFCGHPFSIKSSITRIKAHLGKVKKQDVALCTKVPFEVEEAARNSMPSSSSKRLSASITSNSDMQQLLPQACCTSGPPPPQAMHLAQAEILDGSLQQSHVNVQLNPPLQDGTQQPPPQECHTSGPPPPQSMQSAQEQCHRLQGGASQCCNVDSRTMPWVCTSSNNLLPNANFSSNSDMQQPHPQECCTSGPYPPPQSMRTAQEQCHGLLDGSSWYSNYDSTLSYVQMVIPQSPGFQGVLDDLLQQTNDNSTCRDEQSNQCEMENSEDLEFQENDLSQPLMDNEINLPESQHHMQENHQDDERINPLGSNPCQPIVPQLHHVHIDLLLESSDTPTFALDQAKHEKKRKFLDQRPIGKKLPLRTIFRGPTFNENMDEISRSLEDDSVSRVGIYEMGGSGKTTIMKFIHNMLLEGFFMPCSHVIWLTVSQDYTISKLQHHLASLLKVKLSCDEDEAAWAASLQDEMRTMCYVLILDDVWDNIDLDKIGIPEPSPDNGCKLILTTRSLDVCRKMQCKPIKLNLLSQNEAWELFVKTLDVKLGKSTLESIMKEVVKECACLPLAIVTVAGSMRGIDHVYEWRNALKSLKNCTDGFTEMKEKVIEQLKFSYYKLSEQLQKCLLNCALYPEDKMIDVEELTELLMMDGTIRSNESLNSAYDLVKTMLNKLENACLLTCAYPFKIVIHDLIRDMCLDIIGSRFLVRYSAQSPPIESEYNEVLEKVSLMDSKFKEICLNMAPNCPKLSTLLLSGSFCLTRISDSFFMGFPELKVLNLSGTSVDVLPSSITILVSLNALVLRHCSNLVCLPCLTPLKALKLLDLHRSGIKEVPEGLENLVNLICLRLSHTPIELESSLDVTGMVKLQLLVLPDEIKIIMKDVKEFKNLDFFEAKFANWEDFREYVSFMLNSGQEPSNYRITAEFTCDGASCASMSYESCRKVSEWKDESAGEDYGEWEKERMNATLELRDYSTRGENWLLHEVIGQIPAPEFVRGLSIHGLDIESRSELHLRQTEENSELNGIFNATFALAFANLVELKVNGLNFTKDLISASCIVVESFSSSTTVLPWFRNLQVLEISSCKNFENIVSSANPTEEEESHNPITFPSLRILKLWILPNWRSVLICPSIKYIWVYGCPKLNRLPVQLPVLDYDSGQLTPPLSSLQEIWGELKWWESLEWDQPHAKALLQPYTKLW